MIIVGLGHRKYTGKNTVASLIQKTICNTHPGVSVQIGSFAAKLKDICHQLYAWDGMKDATHYEQYPNEKNMLLPIIGKTVRQIWIEMGTDAVRNHVYDLTWVKCALYPKPEPDVLLLPDLRFKNELKAICDRDGIIVKVQRDMIIETNDVADVDLKDFVDWQFVIKNNGSIDDLKKDISFRCLMDRIYWRLK